MIKAKPHLSDPRVCKYDPCGRQVEKIGDLCCKDHWRMLPRRLRQLLIAEQKKRSSNEKFERVLAAAGACLKWIEEQKIQLPPVEPPKSLILTPEKS